MIFLRFWLWFLLEETLQTTSDFLAGRGQGGRIARVRFSPGIRLVGCLGYGSAAGIVFL